MKHIFLFAFASLLFVGCSKTEAVSASGEDKTYIKPETYTVYFMNCTIEGLNREVRVMLDPELLIDGLMVADLSKELNLPPWWYDSTLEWLEDEQKVLPFYELKDCLGDLNTRVNLYVKNEQIWCFHKCVIADFSRQEQLTGQHIDLVLGILITQSKFNDDFSQLPIDLQMTVPYDWGTSQE